MKRNLKIQDYLSIGYLFLLILGIVRDTVYYGFIGINIIDYSNILDILLSPISYMTGKLPILIAIIILLAFIAWVVKYESMFHTKYRDKNWYGKFFNVEKRDLKFAQEKSDLSAYLFSIIMISFFYLGTGIGGGNKMAQKIKNGDLTMKEHIQFVNNDLQLVRIIGQNSEYIFYVKEGEKNITVSPIKGIIKEIRIDK